MFPTLAVETTVAQFFRRPVPDIMKEFSPKWVGIVYLELYVLFVTSTYYVYLMAYAVMYILHALTGRLPYLSAAKDVLLLEVERHFRQEILKSDYDKKTDVLLSGGLRGDELGAPGLRHLLFHCRIPDHIQGGIDDRQDSHLHGDRPLLYLGGTVRPDVVPRGQSQGGHVPPEL